MSRFEWDGDYEPAEYPNAEALFEARARTAIYSKRGKAALRELREALMALPKHELIEGALCRTRVIEEDEELEPVERVVVGQLQLDGTEAEPTPVPIATVDPWTGDPVVVEGVCAVGAYVWWQKVKSGTDPVDAFLALPELDGDEDAYAMFETASAGRQAGLTFTLAWELASGNDETFAELDPPQRWQRFIEWIDKVLATEGKG
jgi:hypothetical protein